MVRDGHNEKCVKHLARRNYYKVRTPRIICTTTSGAIAGPKPFVAIYKTITVFLSYLKEKRRDSLATERI
jgi:hypothetical protein